jgi:hypothetical protein
MKLRVQHEDGAIETITLAGEWRVQEGSELNRIVGRGFEHFFTHDGYYDGWGAGVSESPAPATEIIDALEQKRQKEKPKA